MEGSNIDIQEKLDWATVCILGLLLWNCHKTNAGYSITGNFQPLQFAGQESEKWSNYSVYHCWWTENEPFHENGVRNGNTFGTAALFSRDEKFGCQIGLRFFREGDICRFFQRTEREGLDEGNWSRESYGQITQSERRLQNWWKIAGTALYSHDPVKQITQSERRLQDGGKKNPFWKLKFSLFRLSAAVSRDGLV